MQINRKFVFMGVLFLCVTFHPSLSKDHEMTVDINPGDRACFFTKTEIGSEFEIEYQVIDGGDLDVNFFVQSPSGSVLLSELKKTDNMHKLEAKEVGDHMFCFDNTFSRFSRKLVFFELTTDEAEPTPDWAQFSVDETEIDMKLDDFRISMDKVKENLRKSFDDQNYLRTVEFRDRYMAECNFERVNFWSCIHLAIMISVGCIQVVMVRSLFEEKSAVGKLIRKT